MATTAMLAGCGGVPSYVGDWRLSGIDCGGISGVIAGMTSTMHLESDSARTLDSVSGCAVAIAEIPVTTAGDGSVSISIGAADSVSCDPDPCAITVSGAGGSITMNCPGDFPVSGIVYDDVARDGDGLTMTWAGCLYSWIAD